MPGFGEKLEIEMLNKSNWPMWKFQMKHLLMARELWEYVEGTACSPDEDGDGAQASYEKDKQKAMATLMMGIL